MTSAFLRHERILKALGGQETLSLDRAVALTRSSPATVRRDFADLAERDLVQRFRGGIRRPGTSGSMVPFALRQVQFSGEKQRLAQHAVGLLRPGDVVIIDGGTTTFHLGSVLPAMPLRVITNSLRLASVLDEPSRRAAGLEIFLTGGFLYPEAGGLLVGPGAHSSLEQYHAHWAFLSVGGITSEGLFNTNEMVVQTERRMIACADRVAVLADHSKLGQHAMCHVCGLDEVDLLITSSPPGSRAALRPLRSRGLSVVTA
jgi:DeoR/GlpR family transcriptional regulator of sugar metabolism